MVIFFGYYILIFVIVFFGDSVVVGWVVVNCVSVVVFGLIFFLFGVVGGIFG